MGLEEMGLCFGSLLHTPTPSVRTRISMYHRYVATKTQSSSPTFFPLFLSKYIYTQHSVLLDVPHIAISTFLRRIVSHYARGANRSPRAMINKRCFHSHACPQSYPSRSLPPKGIPSNVQPEPGQIVQLGRIPCELRARYHDL
jgi:hypothetical protein